MADEVVADYEIEPGVWTFVGDTGIELRYDGPDGVQTVYIDMQGALLLPIITPEELSGTPYWMCRAGNVPLTRVEEPFDLEHPEWWPAGFELVNGKWQKIDE